MGDDAFRGFLGDDEQVSEVKAGDRVRATCGENVIVGTVTWLDEGDLEVDTGDAFGTIGIGWSAAWSVEVIAPPIPDVVGTIVCDRTGEAWQRRVKGWLSINGSRFYTLAELEDYGSPLTVLHARKVLS